LEAHASKYGPTFAEFTNQKLSTKADFEGSIGDAQGKLKPEKAAELLTRWATAIKEKSQAGSGQSNAVARQELAEVKGTPTAVPPDSETLLARAEKMARLGNHWGVLLIYNGITFSPVQLTELCGSPEEKKRSAAARLLNQWEQDIRAKKAEMEKMQGATPKIESPPRADKLVLESDWEKLGLTPEGRQFILDQHNEWRTRFGNKPRLVYDERLEALAQAWANDLAIKSSGLVHRPEKQRIVSGLDGTVGENLDWQFYGGTMYVQNYIVSNLNTYLAKAVKGWGDEYKMCDPKKKNFREAYPAGAGHFTQIVWRATQRVGCGLAIVSVKNQVYLYTVCNYHPAGNVQDQTYYDENM
jgi:pathogenesis-related protein 1